MNLEKMITGWLRAIGGKGGRIGGLLILVQCHAPVIVSAQWRSSLYPDDWQPGVADSADRFLHDFSYAGYHRGEKPIPDIRGQAVDVTQAPYRADPTGQKNSTVAIQSAIDSVAESGGGVVFLPAGTYRIVLPSGSDAALKIWGDKTVFRGAGADKTFLFLDSAQMRHRRVIEVKPRSVPLWTADDAGMLKSPLSRDSLYPTDQLWVQNAALFHAGDLVVARIDLTQRFIDELGMTGKWQPETSGNRILAFCRRVVAVDEKENTLTIDVPTRYSLRTCDNARVVKLDRGMIAEVGLEDFSIGMRFHPGTGLAELDHQQPGTIAYDVNASCAVVFEAAENCWMRRVNSYRPEGNPPKIHILSDGIRLLRSRLVTVENCDWKFPQYLGGGGDGYHYTMLGQDCLLIKSRAEGGRHNFSFGTMASSGNVIVDCVAKDGFLASDFHMWLSPANLIDNMTCDADYIEASYRPYGIWGGNPVHGVTATESVFWNINGLRYGEPSFQFTDGAMKSRPQIIVESKQYGTGYIIGTRGPACAVDSDEDDVVEGVGKGDDLIPHSLYFDQLRRRLKR